MIAVNSSQKSQCWETFSSGCITLCRNLARIANAIGNLAARLFHWMTCSAFRSTLPIQAVESPARTASTLASTSSGIEAVALSESPTRTLEMGLEPMTAAAVSSAKRSSKLTPPTSNMRQAAFGAGLATVALSDSSTRTNLETGLEPAAGSSSGTASQATASVTSNMRQVVFGAATSALQSDRQLALKMGLEPISAGDASVTYTSDPGLPALTLDREVLSSPADLAIERFRRFRDNIHQAESDDEESHYRYLHRMGDLKPFELAALQECDCAYKIRKVVEDNLLIAFEKMPRNQELRLVEVGAGLLLSTWISCSRWVEIAEKNKQSLSLHFIDQGYTEAGSKETQGWQKAVTVFKSTLEMMAKVQIAVHTYVSMEEYLEKNMAPIDILLAIDTSATDDTHRETMQLLQTDLLAAEWRKSTIPSQRKKITRNHVSLHLSVKYYDQIATSYFGDSLFKKLGKYSSERIWERISKRFALKKEGAAEPKKEQQALETIDSSV